MTVYWTVLTQQVLDQLWVRHQWFRVCVDGVSAVLDLSQCFKVAQQYITQPLGVHTGDLPLLGLLIFHPTGSEERSATLSPTWLETFTTNIWYTTDFILSFITHQREILQRALILYSVTQHGVFKRSNSLISIVRPWCSSTPPDLTLYRWGPCCCDTDILCIWLQRGRPSASGRPCQHPQNPSLI